MTDSASTAPTITEGTRKFYAGVALATGALRLLSIPLVGQMPVSELILLVLVAHAVLWLVLYHRLPSRIPRPKFLVLLIVCQLVALFGYIFSDLWRESLPVDMIRGWLRMIFLMIDVGALALLFGSGPQTFLLIQAGTCLSAFQSLIITPIFGDYWKFGFGTPVTVLFILAASKWLGYWGSVFTSMALAALHVILDFRSMAGTCFLLGIFQLCFLIRPNIRKLILLTSGIILCASLPWIAQRMLGEAEGRANRSNVERSAMLQAAWEGFTESPLIGQGSWFSQSQVLDNFLAIRKIRSTVGGGGGMGFDNTKLEGITIHSQILTALAEGGILGGTFFIAYTILIVWSIWYCLTGTPWNSLTPIRLFVLSCSLFDVAMSPFSGIIRLNISITAALGLVLLEEARQRKRAISIQSSAIPKKPRPLFETVKNNSKPAYSSAKLLPESVRQG